MRPYRTNLSLRLPSSALRHAHHASRPTLRGALPLIPKATLRTRRNKTDMPDASHFDWKHNRFHRYEDASEEIRDVGYRNPLNYVELQRQVFRRNQTSNKRLIIYGTGIVACIVAQVFIIFFADDGAVSSKPAPASMPPAPRNAERMDAGRDPAELEGRTVHVVGAPGKPDVKLDADGIEVIETGTSSVPTFPRLLRLPGPSGDEEYTLLGLGIRTVSFLRVQVYVLGMYVRTSDLAMMQAAFVKHVNPMGTSLIPMEKEDLRKQLLDADKSLEVWDKILRESNAKSAVRVIPTRGTDFAHLRDGWVRGVTSRTQEAGKNGSKEYEDEGFGVAMRDFKAVFGGKGKAPKGSTLLLVRDDRGALDVIFQDLAKEDKRPGRDMLGRIDDERISRQVWLGYLGGKSVSSEAARRNIVDGVMELVERPVGTVGVQVS